MMLNLRLFRIFLSGVIVFTVIGYISCAGAATRVPKNLVIFFSAGTKNELFICGCQEKLGGLAKRKTVIDGCEYTRVAVEVGGFSKGSTRFEKLKTETLLKSYNAMDYAVINLGNTEYRMGREVIEEFDSVAEAPFISSNIADESGKLIFAPYKIVDVEGLKIGFIGATTSYFIKDEVREGFLVLDIYEQVAKYVPEVKKQSDLVVVLANARDDEMQSIANKIQGVDIILGGLTFDYSGSDKPTKVGGTIIHKNGGLGKYIGRLRLDLQTSTPVRISNYEGFNYRLEKEIADDPEIEKILDEYRSTLKTTDFTKPEPDDEQTGESGVTVEGSSQPAGEERSNDPSTYLSYVSALKCAECHPDIYRSWRETPHANAYVTLVEEQQQDNPGCLRCHTVGYKRIGGFVNYEETPMLSGVQCENCHGGGARHVLSVSDPSTPGPAITKTVPEQFCLRCHNDEWDPEFSMTEKLPLIEHSSSLQNQYIQNNDNSLINQNSTGDLMESGTN